ncbi:MAG: outer membrane beta-barrel protein [Bdellovibrionales bacterium]
MRIFALLFILLSSASASAGFVEIGASANYRYSGYDKTNYIQSLSYTASASYYFWEMCAFELNYTTGYSKQVSGGTGTDPKETIEDNIELTSADIVLSFAGRQDPFRPYVKLGGGYLIKDRFRRINSDNEDLIAHQEGIVPSGGLGLAINITQALSIKIGLDAWTSPLKTQPVIVDYAGRAGISWMF